MSDFYSYFNEEQQAHMRYLATVPREKRCRCGWYLLGDCPHPECKAAARPTGAPSDE